MNSQKSIPGTLFGFMKTVYAPGLHIAYSAFWFLSLEGFLHSIDGGMTTWTFSWKTIAAILSVFLVLFFLRIIDEIKDFDYDTVHNPDRPLVSGSVTISDMKIYLILTALLTVALNVFISMVLLIVLLCDMLYGTFLIHLERHAPPVKNGMFLNLLFTYPVNIAVTVYIFLFYSIQYNHPFSVTGFLAIATYICAFLHYEIGRKTIWPHHAARGQRHYSSEMRPVVSGLLSLLMALSALAISLFLLAPWNSTGTASVTGWIILLPLIPALYGFYSFIKAGKKNEKPKVPATMTPFAMLFLFLYYVILFIHSSLSVKLDLVVPFK